MPIVAATDPITTAANATMGANGPPTASRATVSVAASRRIVAKLASPAPTKSRRRASSGADTSAISLITSRTLLNRVIQPGTSAPRRRTYHSIPSGSRLAPAANTVAATAMTAGKS